MKIVFIVHVSLCLIFVCVSPVALSQDISEKDVILCGNSDCTGKHIVPNLGDFGDSSAS